MVENSDTISEQATSNFFSFSPVQLSGLKIWKRYTHLFTKVLSQQKGNRHIQYLPEDLGADEVAERQAEPQEGEESDECGVPVPIKDKLKGEDAGCYGRVEVLLPAKERVQVDDRLAPTLETGLDSADLNHGEVNAAHGY